MYGKAHSNTSTFELRSSEAIAASSLLPAILFFISLFLTLTVQAQTYQVIHDFTGGADGRYPQAGLTMGGAGTFYGVTIYGGTQGTGTNCPYQLGCGVVFKLVRFGTGWLLTPLHSFMGRPDGVWPKGRVAIGQEGALYGTTSVGGTGCFGGCGTVFRLQPPASACKTALCPWTETVLHSFTGGADGQDPSGDLTFDAAGNLYGTNEAGGTGGFGAVYELTPSGGGWTATTLYSAGYNNDNAQPVDGVIFDNLGNLYGVFAWGHGELQYGSIYELSPSGGGWIEQNLYVFVRGAGGWYPLGGLLMDSSGNLFGTTALGGTNNGGNGTAFELARGNDGWTFNTIYSFAGTGFGYYGPVAKMTMDLAGNLYGTDSHYGAYECGSIFELTPDSGGWSYRSLHDFDGGDGCIPTGSLILNSDGKLYGTASAGGAYGAGVVFEIAP
jgi:uncharacterized repeat protein (TIGR03803 family)